MCRKINEKLIKNHRKSTQNLPKSVGILAFWRPGDRPRKKNQKVQKGDPPDSFRSIKFRSFFVKKIDKKSIKKQCKKSSKNGVKKRGNKNSKKVSDGPPLTIFFCFRFGRFQNSWFFIIFLSFLNVWNSFRQTRFELDSTSLGFGARGGRADAAAREHTIQQTIQQTLELMCKAII